MDSCPSGEHIDLETLERLPYIAAAVSETLRVIPPAPVYNRGCLQSCKVGAEAHPPPPPLFLSSLLCPSLSAPRSSLLALLSLSLSLSSLGFHSLAHFLALDCGTRWCFCC